MIHPCVQELLDHLRLVRGHSPHTLLAYRTDLEQFLSFLERSGWLELFPEKTEQDHVRGFLLDLRREGLCDASIARKGSALRTLFRRMFRTKQISTNLMGGLRTPQPYRRAPGVLSKGEVAQLFDYWYEDGLWNARDQAVLRVFYGTGVTLQELVDLNVGDFDLKNQTVTVRGPKHRILRMGPDVTAIVGHYIHLKYLHRGGLQLNQNALFVNRFRMRLQGRSVNRVIEKRAHLVGLKRGVSPQILRNSFARHALEAGHSLEDVRRMMGHSSALTTALHSAEKAE